MKLERRLVRRIPTEGAAIGLSLALEREGAIRVSRRFDSETRTYAVEAVLPYGEERDADAA